MSTNIKSRFWEIDALRGVAIIMMVLYHLVYDLSYFGSYDVNVYSGFWRYLARATATLFTLLVGLSLTISFSRAKTRQKPGTRLFPKYLKRGLRIFSWGLIITFTSWILMPERVILFGILHLIGVSIILAYPFLSLRSWNLVIGMAFIAMGLYLQNIRFGFPWLVWLGLQPDHFYPIDYFPLLPWFGVTLVGLFLGNTLYDNSTRKIRFMSVSNFSLIRLLGFMGQHSLVIYLVHQPILITLLSLLGIVDVGFS